MGVPRTNHSNKLAWLTHETTLVEEQGEISSLANGGQSPLPSLEKEDAAPGVQARNGAKNGASLNRSRSDDTHSTGAVATALVVIVDRCGMLDSVLSRQSEARALLIGGRA